MWVLYNRTMFRSESEKRSAYITLFVLGAILLVAGAIAGYIMYERYQEAHAPDIAAIQPEETVVYRDMSGNEIDLRTFAGKPLIVNAWATWSPFSRDELLALAALKHEYGDAFDVLAVNRKEPQSTIEAYLAQIDGDLSGITFIQDEADAFFTTVMGYAMPETIYYNEEGNIVEHVRGNQTEEAIRERIEAMLKTE